MVCGPASGSGGGRRDRRRQGSDEPLRPRGPRTERPRAPVERRSPAPVRAGPQRPDRRGGAAKVPWAVDLHQGLQQAPVARAPERGRPGRCVHSRQLAYRSKHAIRDGQCMEGPVAQRCHGRRRRLQPVISRFRTAVPRITFDGVPFWRRDRRRTCPSDLCWAFGIVSRMVESGTREATADKAATWAPVPSGGLPSHWSRPG